jgi:hypothetical protein
MNRKERPMAARSIVKNILLGFVLVSVGFAMGKQFTLRAMRATQGADPAPAAAGDKVIVYYLHATIRCVTCNTIEKMAHELVQRDFARELQSGRIEWRTADFQTDEALAKRYGVAFSSIVLVRLSQGREVEFKTLADVWTHVNNPAAFNAYVSGELARFLGGRP